MRQRATCHPAGGAATVATACRVLTPGRPRQFASREACGREAVTMQDDDARELSLAEALRRWFLADAREAALFDWWGALAPEKRSRLNVQAAFERRTAGPGLSLKRDGFLHKAVVQPDGSTRIDKYPISSELMQGKGLPHEVADAADYWAARAAAIARLNAALAAGGYELLFYNGGALPLRLTAEAWRAGGLCLTPEGPVVNRAEQRVEEFRGGRFFVAKALDAASSIALDAEPKKRSGQPPAAKITAWIIKKSKDDQWAGRGQKGKRDWVAEVKAEFGCTKNRAEVAYKKAGENGAWLRSFNTRLVPARAADDATKD
jgi:hypothetical protein